ncbi:hypothetical protein [Dietzia sp. 179-F 9C3 NHS]|uniref:hypothetical protein n=1 Tax=Dietzia sp. 179-F 9C3 NHS TaxID=3374295 RepID=UPI003879CEDA
MTLTNHTVLRGAVVSAAAVSLVAGAAMAGAQVPGGDTDGVVVVVDSRDLVVTVDDKGENPTQVTGSIQNTTRDNFRCATPGPNMEGEFPGQVTTAGVVREAVDYYRTNVFTGATGIALGPLRPLGMGSLYDILPAGSSVGSAEVDSRTAQMEARVAGRTGDPTVGNSAVFNVNAGQAVNWTALLGLPATGDRGDWQAAAMFYCINQSSGQHFVFHGYEDVPDPEVAEPESSGSASGSLNAGSLGS